MNGKVPLRDFGSTGRRVAPVGQGSWRAEETGAAAVIASLRRGIDLGMTHIDTAEMYGAGAAETAQADRRLRPFARRAASTRRPPGVAMRARKPWRRLRTSLLGW